MGKLPKPKYASGNRRTAQVAFGGLNHNVAAPDGAIFAMTNLCSDNYPLVSPRGVRASVRTISGNPNGYFCYDGVEYWMDGTALKKYADDTVTTIGTVADSLKQFAAVNTKIVIYPDKKYIDLNDGSLNDMGVTIAAGSRMLKAVGEIYDATAEANTIYDENIDFSEYFKVGDAVTIGGCAEAANNQTIIVREVDGHYLRFAENSFVLAASAFTAVTTEDMIARNESGVSLMIISETGFRFGGNDYKLAFTSNIKRGSTLYFSDPANSTPAAVTITKPDGTEDTTTMTVTKTSSGGFRMDCPCPDFYPTGADTTEAAMTLTRTTPDLDYICEVNNRLWGCKGDQIYASKLGDPLNFNVFDGLSTDSYNLTAGGAGYFTGCINYRGYPTFFKEEAIFKIFGSTPQNFETTQTMTMGVMDGAGKSLAVAGETLFYLSKAGVVAYAGGVPEIISEPLGNMRYSAAVSGSDGTKYFVSMTDGTNYSLFVYDTKKGVWHREDGIRVYDFAWNGKLNALTASEIVTVYPTIEGSVDWELITAPYRLDSPDKKAVAKIHLRLDMDGGSSASVYIKHGNDLWRTVKTVQSNEMRSFYLPLIPRRDDNFRLKINGRGYVEIHSLSIEYYQGSAL